MNRIRAFAAVCVLVVVFGSSASFALGDVSRDAAKPSAQIAVQTGETGSVSVEILSSGHHILSGESDDFVARVVSDGSRGILLGVKADADESASVEFRHPDVHRLSVEWLYQEYTAVGYLPAEDAGTMEDVPVEISPDVTLFPRRYGVQVDSISRSAARIDSDAFTLRVFCSVECGIVWVGTQIWTNLELVIAFLGLLIAFFGRKQIWDGLGLPREREDEMDVETGEQPDAGATDSEPPDADPVGDGQRPNG